MREKLEFILKNKGLTATSLARMLEIQPSGLSHILSGRNKPSFDLVVKILKVFPDLNPDWLLLDSEQVFREDAAHPTASEPTHDDGLPASPLLPFDDVHSGAEGRAPSYLPLPQEWQPKARRKGHYLIR